MTRKVKSWLLLLLSLATIVLMLLPYGAVLEFGFMGESGQVEYARHTYSYFSLTPFGYADFGPLLSAVLTCVLAVLALWFLLRGRGIRAIRTVSVLALVASLLPLVAHICGAPVYSVLGGVISVLLLAISILAFRTSSK